MTVMNLSIFYRCDVLGCVYYATVDFGRESIIKQDLILIDTTVMVTDAKFLSKLKIKC